MKSNYKRIGDFIRVVDERNTGHNVKNLLGLSISKQFIPSVANLVGTDMESYKIIRKNQFACSTMQVRRDKKMPVALLQEIEEAIISQAYPVFEVTDPGELLPEYLMLWFSRQEFDREACFYAIGGVRGSLEWEDFCDMKLPIPKPDKQKEIVVEFNTIVNRISFNDRIIQNLEETAQAIYRQWFVDFEFPAQNGQPYKSNSGEMEFNGELEKEIPKGWKYLPIENISKEIITGKTPPTEDEKFYGNYMPFVTIPDMHNKVFIDVAERYLSVNGVNWQKNKTLPSNSICVSCIGTAGLVALTSEQCQTNQQINSIICKKDVSVYYCFFTLRGLGQLINEWGSKGSVGINMNKTEFAALKIIQPHTNLMLAFDKVVESIFNNIKLLQKEKILLTKLKDLLLSKLATIGNNK